MNYSFLKITFFFVHIFMNRLILFVFGVTSGKTEIENIKQNFLMLISQQSPLS